MNYIFESYDRSSLKTTQQKNVEKSRKTHIYSFSEKNIPKMHKKITPKFKNPKLPPKINKMYKKNDMFFFLDRAQISETLSGTQNKSI